MNRGRRSERVLVQSWGAALKDVTWFGLFFAFLVAVLVYALNGGDIAKSLAKAVELGGEVSPHIGVLLGVEAAFILALYIAAVGNEIAGNRVQNARVRKRFALLSVLMFAMSAPAILLVLLHALSDPRELGVLFMLFPVAAMLLILVTHLGTFLFPSVPAHLEGLREERDWALWRIRTLSKASRRSLWQTLLAQLLMNALLTTVIAGWAIGWDWGLVPLAVVMTAAAAALILVSGALSCAALGAQERVMRIVWQSCLYVLHGALLASPMRALLSGEPEFGWLTWAVVVPITVSALLPLRWSPQFLSDWTIRGAAARLVVVYARRRHRIAIEEIRKYEPEPLSGLRSWRPGFLARRTVRKRH